MYKLSISPYNTRQEEYREDPWKMLMVCFMLNQTSHKKVDQVRHEFFDKFPTAQDLVLAKDIEISTIIKPLGFYNKRAKQWKKFSEQWIEITTNYGTDKPPVFEIENMYGVGKYAIDSWKVFQLYQYGIPVEDHVLNWYVEWAKKEVETQIRESKECEPMTVYYLHYQDDRFIINNWNTCRDYACCVMARTQNEAIEKVTEIASKQHGFKHIKILGFGHAKKEWVNEYEPLKTDEDFYANQVQGVFDRIRARNLSAQDIYNGQQKQKYSFE